MGPLFLGADTVYGQHRELNAVPAAGTAAADSIAVKHPTVSPLGVRAATEPVQPGLLLFAMRQGKLRSEKIFSYIIFDSAVTRSLCCAVLCCCRPSPPPPFPCLLLSVLCSDGVSHAGWGKHRSRSSGQSGESSQEQQAYH